MQGNKPFKQTYQGNVIYRMLGEDEKRMQEFNEEYDNNRGGAGQNMRVEPTPQELKIAGEYKLGVPGARLVKDYGLRDHSALYAIIARVWKWNNK